MSRSSFNLVSRIQFEFEFLRKIKYFELKKYKWAKFYFKKKECFFPFNNIIQLEFEQDELTKPS